MVKVKGLTQPRLEFIKITHCGLLLTQILIHTVVQNFNRFLALLLVHLEKDCRGELGEVLIAIQIFGRVIVEVCIQAFVTGEV